MYLPNAIAISSQEICHLGKRLGNLGTSPSRCDGTHLGGVSYQFFTTTIHKMSLYPVCPVLHGPSQEADKRGLEVHWVTVNGKMIGAPVWPSNKFEFPWCTLKINDLYRNLYLDQAWAGFLPTVQAWFQILRGRMGQVAKLVMLKTKVDDV